MFHVHLKIMCSTLLGGELYMYVCTCMWVGECWRALQQDAATTLGAQLSYLKKEKPQVPPHSFLSCKSGLFHFISGLHLLYEYLFVGVYFPQIMRIGSLN